MEILEPFSITDAEFDKQLADFMKSERQRFFDIVGVSEVCKENVNHSTATEMMYNRKRLGTWDNE